MICPEMSYREARYDKESFVECLNCECGKFDNTTGMCSVISISKNLYHIEQILTEMRIALEKR